MPVPDFTTDLEARLGVAEVQRFARQSLTRVDEVNAEAWAKFRSAALRVYTAASIDALTAETIPVDAKGYIVSDMADIISAGQARAADIQVKADAATLWRSRVATHNERGLDEVLTELSSGTGSDIVRVSTKSAEQDDSNASGNTMDRDNPNSNFRYVDPGI